MKSTKDKILKAASVILETKGSDFSMRKVADEASISLGNLQYYFKTKNDLTNSLLSFYIDLYKTKIDSFISENPKRDKNTVSKALKFILEDLTSKNLENLDRVILTLHNTDEDRKKILENYYRQIYSLIYSVLRKIEPKAQTSNINVATSILLPFMESYGVVNNYIEATQEEIISVFSETIWNLLKK